MSDAQHIPPPRAPYQPLVGPGEVDHHVGDMTATAAADVTLRQYQAKLAEHNQWLPIDGDLDQTLGALVEANSTGPLRLGYGAWRDLLLGAQFRNGRDELITAGGRTVKNVAGYDLTKFIVGQGGVFGKVVTVTTRTYRRPDAALLARFAPNPNVIHRLIPSDCRPQWAVLTSQAVLCGYLGDERAITFYAEALKEHRPLEVLRRTLQDDVEHRSALWCCVGEAFYRAAVPPDRVRDFVDTAKPASWVANLPFGVVMGSCTGDECERLRKGAAAVGGSVYFRTPGGLPTDVSTNAVERRMMERLKQAFDPDGRLAPLPWQSPTNPKTPAVTA